MSSEADNAPGEEVAEALDPATPPALLDARSRSPHAAVRRSVAANPGSPPGVLLRLAVEFPQEVIDNPALRLHLLSDPGLFASLPLRTVEIVLQKAEVPEILLLALLAHPSGQVRVAVASSLRIPPELLDRLASDPDDHVRRAAAANPLTPPGAVERLSRDASWPLRAAVAGRPGASASLLGALASDACSDVRMAAACNPSTPSGVLERLALDPRAWVRRGVAGNPASSACALERLADDADLEVRHLLGRRAGALQGGLPQGDG